MKALYRSDVSKSTLGSKLDDIKESMSTLSTTIDSFNETGEVLKGRGYDAVRNSVQASKGIIDEYKGHLDNASNACKTANDGMVSYLDSCNSNHVDDRYKNLISIKYNNANRALSYYESYDKDSSTIKNLDGKVAALKGLLNELEPIKNNIDKLDATDNGQFDTFVSSITTASKTDKIKKVPTISSLFDDMDFTNYSSGGLKNFSNTFFYSLYNYNYFKDMSLTSKKIIIEAFSYLGKGIKYSQPKRNKVINGTYYLDCSSFVSKVYKSVFPDDFGVVYDVDGGKVTCVTALRKCKKGSGLKKIKRDIKKLIPGDLVIQQGMSNHVVIYLGKFDTPDSKGKKHLVIHCHGKGIKVTERDNFADYDYIVRHETVSPK